MSKTITFCKPNSEITEDSYVFDSDTKVEKIMFPLNKTLVLKINNEETNYSVGFYDKWTMSKVSEEIVKKLNNLRNISSVEIELKLI